MQRGAADTAADVEHGRSGRDAAEFDQFADQSIGRGMPVGAVGAGDFAEVPETVVDVFAPQVLVQIESDVVVALHGRVKAGADPRFH